MHTQNVPSSKRKCIRMNGRTIRMVLSQQPPLQLTMKDDDVDDIEVRHQMVFLVAGVGWSSECACVHRAIVQE